MRTALAVKGKHIRAISGTKQRNGAAHRRPGRGSGMNEHIFENAFWLLITVLLIGFVWQAAEMIFYGEIQPRKVDDLMSVVWTVAVVLAYKRGYRHGKGGPQ